ncbi:MAG: hypothetical protein AB7E37_05930 [Candidatus Altimarinota bacterium]
MIKYRKNIISLVLVTSLCFYGSSIAQNNYSNYKIKVYDLDGYSDINLSPTLGLSDNGENFIIMGRTKENKNKIIYNGKQLNYTGIKDYFHSSITLYDNDKIAYIRDLGDNNGILNINGKDIVGSEHILSQSSLIYVGKDEKFIGYNSSEGGCPSCKTDTKIDIYTNEGKILKGVNFKDYEFLYNYGNSGSDGGLKEEELEKIKNENLNNIKIHGLDEINGGKIMGIDGISDNNLGKSTFDKAYSAIIEYYNNKSEIVLNGEKVFNINSSFSTLLATQFNSDYVYRYVLFSKNKNSFMFFYKDNDSQKIKLVIFTFTKSPNTSLIEYKKIETGNSNINNVDNKYPLLSDKEKDYLNSIAQKVNKMDYVKKAQIKYQLKEMLVKVKKGGKNYQTINLLLDSIK